MKRHLHLVSTARSRTLCNREQQPAVLSEPTKGTAGAPRPIDTPDEWDVYVVPPDHPWWPLMGWPNFALAALGWAIIWGAVWLFLEIFG